MLSQEWSNIENGQVILSTWLFGVCFMINVHWLVLALTCDIKIITLPAYSHRSIHISLTLILCSQPFSNFSGKSEQQDKLVFIVHGHCICSSPRPLLYPYKEERKYTGQRFAHWEYFTSLSFLISLMSVAETWLYSSSISWS